MKRSQQAKSSRRPSLRAASRQDAGPCAEHRVALAVAAHPDDIEFCMAGTLLLLKNAGFEIHYLTLANGCCGSLVMSAEKTRKVRLREAREAAGVLGAHFHEPLVNDLEIVYEVPLLRRLAAHVREIKPNVVLTHSPRDYMEDHTCCCRLTVTATFARGMPNFRTQPPRQAWPGDTTIYHAMPHGLCDPLRKRIIPGSFVNTESVHTVKRAALAAHRSQKDWLDASQGLDSYLLAMDEMSAAVGKLSGSFQHAEGWRRHLHYGFCAAHSDPLAAALGKDHLINERYEADLRSRGPLVPLGFS